MARKEAPAKLKCKELWGGYKSCHWECAPWARVVKFTSRRHPTQSVIVHRSVRPSRKGIEWQATMFDEAEGLPTGHMEGVTCAHALDEAGVDQGWRLIKWR